MNKPTIAALTWATLMAAVISACSLAGGDAGLPDHRLSFLTGVADPEPLSVTPSRHAPVVVTARRRPPPPPASVPQRALPHLLHAAPLTEKV